MQLPKRKYTSGNEYLYVFTGQEKSDEIADGLTTAMFWEYDSRIGRRWNMDPEFKKYPNESPYLTFHCNPVLFSDLKGDTPPKNFKEYKNTVNGQSVFLPKSATVELFTEKNNGGDQSLIGKIKAFTIGKSRFTSTWSITNGRFFEGYQNWYNGGEKYMSPDFSIDGSITGVNMNMFTSSINIGKDGVSKVIQIVTTSLPTGTAKYKSGGMEGFVDGGVNSPGARTYNAHNGVDPGTPYFISTLPSSSNGKNYTEDGNKGCNDFTDAPGTYNTDGSSNPLPGVNNFQTIIVAQNFYGSGQNIVMGVYNWGFKDGVQTHSNGRPKAVDLSTQSINILKTDYPNYQLKL